MTGAHFFAVLSEEILTHPLFQCGFVRHIASVSHFPLEAARRFALAYYPHILHTRRYQAQALAVAEDEQVQFAFAQILADEYGNGDPERTHMELYRRFMRALQIGEEEIASGGDLFPELRLYIDAMMGYTRSNHWLAAASAAGIAMELPIPFLYREFLKGLRRIPGIDEEALTLFTEHIVVDINHSHLVQKALLPYAEQPEKQQIIREGVRYNLDARLVMMQGLDRIVFGS